MASVRMHMSVSSSEELEASQTHTFQVALFYIETSLVDGDVMISNYDKIEELVDKVVPKYDPTSLLAEFSPTDSDYIPGDADDDLMYRLDKLPLSILTNPQGPVMLKRYRPWLGWYEGSAFRTGNTDKVRTLWTLDEMLRFGIHSRRNAYLVLMPVSYTHLTLPTKA